MVGHVYIFFVLHVLTEVTATFIVNIFTLGCDMLKQLVFTTFNMQTRLHNFVHW